MPIEIIIIIAILTGAMLVIIFIAYAVLVKKAKMLSNAELVPLLIARNRELKVICITLYLLDIVAVICAVIGIIAKIDVLRNCAVGIFMVFTFVATTIVFQRKNNFKIINSRKNSEKIG